MTRNKTKNDEGQATTVTVLRNKRTGNEKKTREGPLYHELSAAALVYQMTTSPRQQCTKLFSPVVFFESWLF